MEKTSLANSQPSQAPPLYSVRPPLYEWSGSAHAQPCVVVRWWVGCAAPVASGNDKPACLPSAPGSHPSRWSKDRFSMHTTTMWSMPEAAGFGSADEFDSLAADASPVGSSEPTAI